MSPVARCVALALAGAALGGAGSAAAAVGDPLLDQQWPLARENVLGRAAAWQQSTGAGAIVAVLDTGVDFKHPDLQGAFWTNPGEIPGNGIDDDHDGFVDDVHGADVVNNDGDPTDDEGHGTHVAGIIAARANNGIGGAGLAPDAQLMIVKVLGSQRDGTTATLAQGIRYAVEHGAKIINTSVNGDNSSRALQDAIRAAGAAGALVVASAGNDGRDIDVTPSYPAAYPDPAIVSVAATDATGALSDYSNHGALSVDIAAPGDGILSTADGEAYELRSGTSMAAPYVSATLALMESARPALGGPALKAALLAGAAHSDLLTGDLLTGTLDAAGALRALLGTTGWRGSLAPLGLVAQPANHAPRGATLSWTLAGDSAGVATVRVWVSGRLVGEHPVTAPSTLRVRARPGLHPWRVAAFDAAGTQLAEATGFFRVRHADWPAVKRRAHRAA